MTPSQTGPQLMGIDVFMVATALAAVACIAVFVAIYAAVTVRDPMAKRVKALTETARATERPGSRLQRQKSVPSWSAILKPPIKCEPSSRR